MNISDVVSELKLELQETQNQRDKRVEALWQRLDPQKTGELDLKGLKRGFQRIDHPLKNAESMLKDILRMVDTNGDGIIQYEEFRVFVEAAERHLRFLFRSIDSNHDGRVNREELEDACRKAGLTVSKSRFDGFFDELDMNHDGFISFGEFRDFLLFIPTNGRASPLEAAYSFYTSVVRLTAEGDSVVSDETLQGLGMSGSFLRTLFGSLVKLASPDPRFPYRPLELRLPFFTRQRGHDLERPTTLFTTARPTTPPPTHSYTSASSPIVAPRAAASFEAKGEGTESLDFAGCTEADMAASFHESSPLKGLGQQPVDRTPSPHLGKLQKAQKAFATEKSRLTSYLPEPGYFLVGAVAGALSRTATAPLDRLKVYLLVSTKTGANIALDAAKHGHPLAAIVGAVRPIGEAIRCLYRIGGLRTFFAGNGLNVIKIMPETAIKFGSYEAAKRTLSRLEGHNDPNAINPYSRFAAGGLAGMAAQFCVYPLDTLKFRLQAETVEGGLRGNSLLVQTAKKMYADGGARAAYRGITMGLIGMFPYSAIEMGTFEFLKKTFTKYKARKLGIHEEDAKPGNFVTGAMGATSGAFGATVVYPLNVLRTRLQTQGTVMHPPTYTGIVDVGRKTIKNEGFRGLYKGLTPNMLKVAPAMSITWICYENGKKILGLQ